MPVVAATGEANVVANPGLSAAHCAVHLNLVPSSIHRHTWRLKGCLKAGCKLTSLQNDNTTADDKTMCGYSVSKPPAILQACLQ